MLTQFSCNMRLAWPELPNQDENVVHLFSVLSAETDKDAEERREKQKWDNFVPASEKRPLDEFFDLSVLESIEPIDISSEKDGQLLKYITKEGTSKFNRLIEEADIVHYMHETRFDNGQLCDFDEKRKAKEKFEMAN